MTEPISTDSEELDWNIERDGRMRDYATDDEPATIPWEG